MSLITFEESDLKRGVLLDPGMYDVNIVHYKEVADKNGAPLHKFRYETFGHENPDFNDVSVFDQFSSKAMGFFVPVWEAVTGAKPVAGESYDPEYIVNKSMRISINREIYEGTPQNKVSGYAPLSA